jgi:hypothetical protein
MNIEGKDGIHYPVGCTYKREGQDVLCHVTLPGVEGKEAREIKIRLCNTQHFFPHEEKVKRLVQDIFNLQGYSSVDKMLKSGEIRYPIFQEKTGMAEVDTGDLEEEPSSPSSPMVKESTHSWHEDNE